MNLALIGPSGVGKGTHASALCSRFNLSHVATGDLFRHHLQTRSALGLLARKYMDQGELIPDEVVDAMIEEWCEQHPAAKGILFDGFPRTVCQAVFLDELLQSHELSFDAVIYLRVPDEEIVHRLAGRLICRQCQAPWHATLHPPKTAGICDLCGGALKARPDDIPALISTRLRVFHRTTGPLLEHYANAGRLAVIDGTGTTAEVGARLADFASSLELKTAKFTSREAAAPIIAAERVAQLPAHLARVSLDLVLLGGPGSGKGTQAERLCAELKLPHIATGDLFRDNLRNNTELGRLARTYMDRGELVPDDVTEAMVEERLARSDTHAGFVLDGFPRTLTQATALMDMVAQLHRRISGVLYIKVSDEAIISRLSGRLICRKCQAPYHLQFKPPHKTGVCDTCGGELYQRADDNPNTVRARLVTFHSQTEPLIAFYRRAGLLHEIAGEGALADISARCLAAVSTFAPVPPA
jgi:adenylate kinase